LLNVFTKAYHLDEKIHFPPDYLYQMLDVEAAVGLAQLDRYDAIIATRRKNAVWYDQNLERREGWVFPPIMGGATYSHYVVRVPERESVLKEWARQGVQLGELIQYSIPLLPEYARDSSNEFFRSNAASSSTLNFPITRSKSEVRR
jgi:dTDP-4-amino-4,6-dideoxygalactose transaminase